MQFNSYLFILAYLPVVILGYFLLNKINALMGKIFLMLASILFYIYGGFQTTAVLAASIIINFSFIVFRLQVKDYKRIVLNVVIIVNVILLLYFKYSNFCIQTLNDVAGYSYNMREIVLPIGVSFFTFQNMAVSESLLNAFVLPETYFLFHILRLENVSAAVRGFSMLAFIAGAYFVCLGPENNYKKRIIITG